MQASNLPKQRDRILQQYAHTRANWGATQEEAYLSDLFARLQRIAERPLLGRARPELGENIRSLINQSHFIIYRPKPDGGVWILRIIHQSRDLPDEFGE